MSISNLRNAYDLDINIKTATISEITSVDNTLTNILCENMTVSDNMYVSGDVVLDNLQLGNMNSIFPQNPSGEGQVLTVNPQTNQMSWIDNGSGGSGVTNIQSGNNNILCTPSQITSTGTIALNNNLTNINSIDTTSLNTSIATIGGNLYPESSQNGYLYCNGQGLITYQTPNVGQATIITSPNTTINVNQTSQYAPQIDISNNLLTKINSSVQGIIGSHNMQVSDDQNLYTISSLQAMQAPNNTITIDVSNNNLILADVNSNVYKVKDIVAGTNVTVDVSNNVYTINSTGGGGNVTISSDGSIQVSEPTNNNFILNVNDSYTVKSVNSTSNNLINTGGVIDISANLITKIDNSIQNITNTDNYIDITGTTTKDINLSNNFKNEYKVKDILAGNNIYIGPPIDGVYVIDFSGNTSNVTINGTNDQIHADLSGNTYTLSLYDEVKINKSIKTFQSTTNDGIGDNIYNGLPPTGNYNLALGDNAGSQLSGTNSNNNVIIGSNACSGTGGADNINNNIILGVGAAQNINASSNNIIIGYLSGGFINSNLTNNNIIIGNQSNITQDQSNAVIIGNSSSSSFRLDGIGFKQVFSYRSTTTSFSFYNAGGTSLGNVIKTYDTATLINTFNEFAIYLSTSSTGFSTGNFEQGVGTSYLISDSLNSKFNNFDVIGSTQNWQSTQINSYIPCFCNTLIVCCASIVKTGSNYYVKILPVDSNNLFPMFSSVFKLNYGIDGQGNNVSNTQYSSWCLGRWYADF